MPISKDDKNFSYCQEALSLKDEIEGSFVGLGEHLMVIRDEQKYRPQWDSFSEFLEEMHMSEPTASKLISTYDKFVLGFGYTAAEVVKVGGWSTIAELLPIVTTKADAETWLHEASVLNRRDLRIKIGEAKSGKPQEACAHEDSYILKVCRTCGYKEKVITE